MTKTQIVERWYRDVWINGDLDAIDAFFAPGARAEGILPDLAITAADFRDLVTVIRDRIDGIEVTIAKSIEQGNWLSCLLEVRAFDRASGDPIHAISQIMMRFDGDKMVETYNSFDFLTMFEQMGQLPPNTLPLLLTGATLR